MSHVKIWQVGISVMTVLSIVAFVNVVQHQKRQQTEENVVFETEAEEQQMGDTSEKLVVALPFVGISRDDLNAIEEKINEITRKEIGVTVEFPYLQSYHADVTMMLSVNEQIDLMIANYGVFMEEYVNGHLLPLDKLFKEYGKGIASQIAEEKIDSCRINNNLYGIPANSSYTEERQVYYLNEKILKKEGINLEDIDSEDDLEEVFDQVHRNNPDMTVLTTNEMTTLMGREYYLSTSQGIPLMASMNQGRNEELEVIIQSDDYREALKRSRRWYVKGYYKDDIWGETDNVYERVETGNVFACLGGSKSIMKKLGMVDVHLDDQLLNYYGYSTKPYVIPDTSISPEKAMMLLNLFYTDKRIENYLCYGIEGIHYKKNQDGSLANRNGETDPFLFSRMVMPNPFIADVWEGEGEDYWKQINTANETAIQSNIMGFNFDYSKVEAEYRTVLDIYNNYKWILENGIVNSEEGLEQMSQAMNNAGLKLVVQEERKQYRAWKKYNKGEGK